MSWTVQGLNPGRRKIFRTHPCRPWETPKWIPGLSTGRGVDHPPLSSAKVNPLNAELNPICHLLILGNLTFMCKCIVLSNKMQRYTVYLYLETALHVSGGTSTHHQERIQLYLQHLVFVTPLLLSATIVEELEPVWVCCGWRTHTGLVTKIRRFDRVVTCSSPSEHHATVVIVMPVCLLTFATST
jgi:hypothetical protein